MANEKLQALFLGPNQVDLIFHEVTNVQARRSNSASQKPVPNTTTAVDSEMRQPCILNVDGYAHCAVCGVVSDNTRVASMLEKTLTEARYSVNNFYHIAISDYAFFRNMTLKDFNISKEANRRQMIRISTVWEGRYISGSAANPFVMQGGIVV